MTAAPELLAALDDILAFEDENHPGHAELHEQFNDDCLGNDEVPEGRKLKAQLMAKARAAAAKARGAA